MMQNLRPYRFTLAPGGVFSVAARGTYIHVLSAPVNDLTVRFDSGEPCPLYQGVGMDRTYDHVEFSSAAGQDVIVYLGNGRMHDGRGGGGSGSSVTVASSNTIDNGGDVACVSGAASLLMGVDATRQYAIICNPSSNTATVRIGSAAVGAANGVPLEPGESIFYPMTSAVYAYQNSGAAVTISAAAVKKV